MFTEFEDIALWPKPWLARDISLSKRFADPWLAYPMGSSRDTSAKADRSESGSVHRRRVNLEWQHNRLRRSHCVLACSKPEWMMGITQKKCRYFANATRRRRFMANACP